MKCLRKAPSERYASMKEVLKDIVKALLAFPSLNFNDVILETTSMQSTKPITTPHGEMVPTLQTPSVGIRSVRVRRIPPLVSILMIALLAVLAGFLILRRHPGSYEMEGPGSKVIDPRSIEVSDELPPMEIPPPPPVRVDQETVPSKSKPHRGKTPGGATPGHEPAQAAHGTLSVTCNTGAKILVDGAPKGRFPPKITLSLSPGQHTVTWKAEGDSYQERVTVRPREMTPAHHSFARAVFGRINIRTPIGSPWGVVYIDGKRQGTTPLNGLKLPVGSHRIEVRREGFKTQVRTVQIVKGQILDWPVKLYPVQ